MMKKIVLLILCITNLVLAQDNALELRTRVETRYDDQEDENRQQNRVRLGFTYNINGQFKLISVASTGSNFTSDWNTVFSDDPDFKYQSSLNLRQLYLQYDSNGSKVQLGSIPTIKKDAAINGLDKSGWIDGVRIQKNYADSGVIEIVAGSITNLNEPNLLQRSYSLNFFEIEISQNLFNELNGSLKYEHFLQTDFLKAELKYDWEIFGDKVLKISSDVIKNLQTNGTSSSITTKLDLLSTILNKYDKKLELATSFIYVDNKFGERAQLSDGSFGTGFQFRTEVKGKINNNLSWFANVLLSNEKRFNVGLRYQFNKKVKKRKKPLK